MHNEITSAGTGPSVLLLPVTLRCNARCVMCTIWKNDPLDLTLDTVRAAMSDGVLSRNLHYLGLTGGEPVLHPELIGITSWIVNQCPNLSEISFNTNGFLPQRTIQTGRQLLDIIRDRSIVLKVYISLDGTDGVHDEIRGRPGIFESAVESAILLRDIARTDTQIETIINSVICGMNAGHVPNTFRFAKDLGLPVNFSLVMDTDTCINSHESEYDFKIKPEQKPDLIRFFSRMMMAVKLRQGDPIERQYYQHLIDTLKGVPRRLGCPFNQRKGCLLAPSGDVYVCGASERLIMGNVKHQSFGTFWNDPQTKKNIQNLLKKICPQCESNCFVHVSEEKD